MKKVEEAAENDQLERRMETNELVD